MDYFLEHMKLILSIMGFKFLIRQSIKPYQNLDSAKRQIDVQDQVYSIRSSGINAQMIESSEGFIVLSGSQCNMKVAGSMSSGWQKLRSTLAKKGTLRDVGSYYEFQEDVIFSSPSAAASVILGRQAAGPLEWMD